MKKIIGTVILSLLLLAACSGGEDNVTIPSGVIPPDTMRPLLVDFYLTEAAIQVKVEQQGDVRQFIVDSYTMVFDKHHITKQRYMESLEFYSNHPQLYREMYEKVIEDLSKEQTSSLKQ